jgi:hypothetical protein
VSSDEVRSDDVRGEPLRSRSRIVGVLGVLGVALSLSLAACSSSPGAAYPIYRSDGGATTPIGPSTIGGNPDVSLGMPSGTVTVTIVAPAGNTNALGTNLPLDLDAKVTIAGGTDVVDPQSVTATLTLKDTSTVLAKVPLVGPTGAMGDEYVGKLPLVGLKTGTYTVTVAAKSSSNATGAATRDVNVDAGPLITVISPLPNQHVKGSIVVLVAIDAGAAPPVQNVQAQIGAMPVPLKETATPGLYRAVFDLTLPIPLVGEQLFVVSADDMNHKTGQVKFTFVVDLAGPTITNTTPVAGTIVGGIIRIGASISDDAGLNESTLQVLIGDNKTTQFRLPLTPDGAGHYGAVFDTNNLTKCGLKAPSICIVRPTISFRASDNLGNESTVSYELAVDNFPPIADLSPPRIRVSKRDEGFRCSTEFDPLDFKEYDGDAPNDLCQVPQLFDLRGRIQDDGNYASGIKQIPISPIDEDLTAAYILDTVAIMGVAQPLVVDTDGDGYCDNVNPKLEPTTTPLTGPKQVLKVRMKPVPPGGKGNFYPPDYLLPKQPTMLPSPCIVGRETDPPLDLCKLGPQPTVAISFLGQAAIWSIEPIAPSDANYCFGSQLDTRANNILPPASAATAATGWKCIAIVTADKVGNHSTSAPIRVYLPDYDNGGSKLYCPAIPAAAGPPPSCTGTYDRATGVVTSKACMTRNFSVPPGKIEVCPEGECGDSVVL